MSKTEDVIRLAIGAAGQMDDYMAWRGRVLAGCTSIAGMLNEHSLEWHVTKRVLDGEDKDTNTSVFIAEYLGYTYEESSTRCYVKVRDARSGEVDQRGLRTDRTDELMGQMMRQRLDAIAPGTKCRIWKNKESFGTPSDPKSFRVLAHIEPMSKRDEDQVGSPAPPQASDPPVAPNAGGSGTEDATAASSVPSNALPPIEECVARLTGPQKLTVAKAAAAAKIYDIYHPGDRAEDLRKIIELNL